MRRRAEVRLAVHWGTVAVVAAVVLGAMSVHDDASRSSDDPPARDPAPTLRCTEGPVALTFDDGPSRENSRRLADILARHRVQATFFMTGRSVTAQPGRARMLAGDGHRIYNHTYDHVDLTSVPDGEIRGQIDDTRRAFALAGVTSGSLVRPPYGAVNGRVRATLRDMGYRTVLWTIDTNDWDPSRTPHQIFRSVMRGLAPHADVLLHDTDDADATVRVLPRLIRAIRARGHCLGVVDERGHVVRPDRAP